ncbi:MAG: HNH endonuclease [Luteolibacter sp.]
MRVLSDTECHGIVRQRIGQDEFRKRLIKHWGSCAITGLKNEKLLRASHAKPWKDCSSDKERLDVFNGFLLAPHFDVLFDQGLMTFENTGAVKFSSKLLQSDLEILGLKGDYALRSEPEPGHLPYLEWHGKHVFIP